MRCAYHASVMSQNRCDAAAYIEAVLQGNQPLVQVLSPKVVHWARQEAYRLLHPGQDASLRRWMGAELTQEERALSQRDPSLPLRDIYPRLASALWVLVCGRCVPLACVGDVFKKLSVCAQPEDAVVCVRMLQKMREEGATVYAEGLERVAQALQKAKSLHIVFAAMEMRPYCGTGGLGSVMRELPAALAKMGHRVTVFIPKHACIKTPHLQDTGLGGVVQGLGVGAPLERFKLFQDTTPEGVQVYFIENDTYFSGVSRTGIYGPKWGGDYRDNAQRYDFFGWCIPLAIRETAGTRMPDVVQLNDAHPASAALYMHMHPAFAHTKVVMAVHNLGASYQGRFHERDLHQVRFAEQYYYGDVRGPGPAEFYQQINFLKLGLLYADGVITVSREYMREVLEPTRGEGLEGVLRMLNQEGRLWGNLNGLDDVVWNPSTDPYLAEHYSFEKPEGKKACKAWLQEAWKLPVRPEVPLFGVLARLTEQKGWGDVRVAVRHVLERTQGNAQWVLCGQGDPRIALQLSLLSKEFPEHVVFDDRFDEKKEHTLYAGCDFFVMPSQFEPSGLPQMYAMRYLTVPLVRAVGGLQESVQEYDAVQGTGCGFKFTSHIRACVDKALAWYAQGEKGRLALLRGCAQADFSWERSSAPEQVAFYRKVLQMQAREESRLSQKVLASH
jgi:starch synthase